MSELVFDADQFRSAINELVPSHQRDQVLAAVNLGSDSVSDFDQLGTALTGEQKDIGFLFLTSAPNTKSISTWGAIKTELYDYLCTTSKKYSDERKEGALTIKQLITIVATAVASTFHLAIGVIVGAVIVAVMSALKIGRNAWCTVNKPQTA